MSTLINKKLLGLILICGLLFFVVIRGCEPSSQLVSGEQIFKMFKSLFPYLNAGKNLLITTGKYCVCPLEEIQKTLKQIYEETKLPDCRFKAATVYSGELHQRLNLLIAAGYAMNATTPPWLLVFLAVDSTGTINIYYFDPLKDPDEKDAIRILDSSFQVQFVLM